MSDAPTGESRTLDQALATAHALDEQAQLLAHNATALKARTDGLTTSQQAFHTSLGPAGADIDDDTLAGVARMSAGNAGLSEEAGQTTTAVSTLAGLLGGVVESLGGHRRVAEAVQAHGGSAKSGFYRPA